MESLETRFGALENQVWSHVENLYNLKLACDSNAAEIERVKKSHFGPAQSELAPGVRGPSAVLPSFAYPGEEFMLGSTSHGAMEGMSEAVASMNTSPIVEEFTARLTALELQLEHWSIEVKQQFENLQARQNSQLEALRASFFDHVPCAVGREVPTVHGKIQVPPIPIGKALPQDVGNQHTSFANGGCPDFIRKIPTEGSVANTADLWATVYPRDIEDVAKSFINQEKDKEFTSGDKRRLHDFASVQDRLCTGIFSFLHGHGAMDDMSATFESMNSQIEQTRQQLTQPKQHHTPPTVEEFTAKLMALELQVEHWSIEVKQQSEQLQARQNSQLEALRELQARQNSQLEALRASFFDHVRRTVGRDASTLHGTDQVAPLPVGRGLPQDVDLATGILSFLHGVDSVNKDKLCQLLSDMCLRILSMEESSTGTRTKTSSAAEREWRLYIDDQLAVKSKELRAELLDEFRACGGLDGGILPASPAGLPLVLLNAKEEANRLVADAAVNADHEPLESDHVGKVFTALVASAASEKAVGNQLAASMAAATQLQAVEKPSTKDIRLEKNNELRKLELQIESLAESRAGGTQVVPGSSNKNSFTSTDLYHVDETSVSQAIFQTLRLAYETQIRQEKKIT